MLLEIFCKSIMSLEEERKEMEKEVKEKDSECVQRRNRRNEGKESDIEKTEGAKGSVRKG